MCDRIRNLDAPQIPAFLKGIVTNADNRIRDDNTGHILLSECRIFDLGHSMSVNLLRDIDRPGVTVILGYNSSIFLIQLIVIEGKAGAVGIQAVSTTAPAAAAPPGIAIGKIPHGVGITGTVGHQMSAFIVLYDSHRAVGLVVDRVGHRFRVFPKADFRTGRCTILRKQIGREMLTLCG